MTEWLDFIGKVVGALAWPLVCLTLGLVYRSDIKRLLGKLKTFEAAGAKAAFTEEVTEVAAAVKQVPAPGREATAALEMKWGLRTTPALESRMQEAERVYETENVAKIRSDMDLYASILHPARWDRHTGDSATAVVLGAWSSVEAVLWALGTRLGISGELRPREYNQTVLDKVVAERLVPAEAAYLIGRLSELRDQVAHSDFEPDFEAAIAYDEAAQRLSRLLAPVFEQSELKRRYG